MIAKILPILFGCDDDERKIVMILIFGEKIQV
jgi:hypothetical protein